MLRRSFIQEFSQKLDRGGGYLPKDKVKRQCNQSIEIQVVFPIFFVMEMPWNFDV